MRKLTYCKFCVMPDTKPFLTFDQEGVCTACRAHEVKRRRQGGIDWAARAVQLHGLIETAKHKRAALYDVLVPVSGGKDSFFQVQTALQHGLRTLCVNVDYGIKTEIGRRNLERMPDLGATLVVVKPEQHYHKRMIKIGFEDYGDPDLMSHGLLYAYPMWVAVQFQIPLILWGENSAFEYGGDAESRHKWRIDRDWFLKHVMTRGVTVDEIAARYDIPKSVLKLYDFPERYINEQGIDAVFLSHFFLWDSEAHLEIAKGYGFEGLPEAREGTFRRYVGIDEKINRIHQYMKVLKFGYGRATDHACEEIRNGRLSRAQAVRLVRAHDRQELSPYYVSDFIELLGYTESEFRAIIEQYRNQDIWSRIDGAWVLDDSALDG